MTPQPVAGQRSQRGFTGGCAIGVRRPVRANGRGVSAPPVDTMRWTPAQQLAHLTADRPSLRTGDLYACGTASGPERRQVGSFLELTWGGADPLVLPDGSTRTFRGRSRHVCPDGGTHRPSAAPHSATPRGQLVCQPHRLRLLALAHMIPPISGGTSQ